MRHGWGRCTCAAGDLGVDAVPTGAPRVGRRHDRGGAPCRDDRTADGNSRGHQTLRLGPPASSVLGPGGFDVLPPGKRGRGPEEGPPATPAVGGRASGALRPTAREGRGGPAHGGPTSLCAREPGRLRAPWRWAHPRAYRPVVPRPLGGAPRDIDGARSARFHVKQGLSRRRGSFWAVRAGHPVPCPSRVTWNRRCGHGDDCAGGVWLGR